MKSGIIHKLARGGRTSSKAEARLRRGDTLKKVEKNLKKGIDKGERV